MKINVKENLDIKMDVLALGLFEDDKDYYGKYNKELAVELKDAIEKKRFEKKFGQLYATTITKALYKRTIVISLGSKIQFTEEKLRRAMSIIVKFLKDHKYKGATTNIASISGLRPHNAGLCVGEGLVLSEYSFQKYKSEKTLHEFEISIQYPSNAEFSRGVEDGRIIARAANHAKDLVNEPAAFVTPEYLENEAKIIAKDKRIKLTILDKQELAKHGLNALLAVSAGSDRKPKLIILRYNGAKNEPYTAVVGKGITFDSGGYDLKPEDSMFGMKDDMAGAAVVLGTIETALKLGLKRNIIGVIPTCENLVNGSAYKPGDILRAYNGKTIEVLNTDAEGRLILCDAISYVEKNYSPETIIDLATLTGACVVALGYECSGLWTNDDKLRDKLVKAGHDSHERVWPMPFFEEYHDSMDGSISDLQNLSNKPDRRAGGAITAAVFLSKFVEKAKWAHIDIAGPASIKEEPYYLQKGATGFGVRLLTYYFKG